MTAKNHIKNFGISILFLAVFVYFAILNYSPVKLAAAGVSAAVILLFSSVFQKEKCVAEKIDIYILVTFFGILVLKYEEIISGFSVVVLKNFQPLRLLFPLFGFGAYLILNAISKKRKTLAAKAINKFLGLFLFSASVFSAFHKDFSSFEASFFLSVFFVFGLIAFCGADSSEGRNTMGRPAAAAVTIASLCTALSVICPSFGFTAHNFGVFLSETILPWYTVLFLTVSLLAIIGLGLHFGGNMADMDTVFLGGIIGLIWVTKAAAYFYFQMSWIAVVIYALLMLNYIGRFVKRSSGGVQIFDALKFSGNYLYQLLLSAVLIVLSVYLIHKGYIYLFLSLSVGAVPLLLVHRSKRSGWIKDAAFWSILLLYISFSGCMLSIQSGYSGKKIIFIAAVSVFALIPMFMLNYKNTIGYNKFGTEKALLTGLFIVIVLIAAFKSGTNICVEFADSENRVGSIIPNETNLTISVEEGEDENSLKLLKYVWSDSFFYDEKEIVSTSLMQCTTDIENNHLIVWAENEAGVVTRKDFWFYYTVGINDSPFNVPLTNDDFSNNNRNILLF